MTGTREGAITQAQRGFDDGRFLDGLRRMVAVPTESQMPDSEPALRRYVTDTMPALMEGMGFSVSMLENSRPKRGPVFLATRVEDPSLPTVLVYGHGDVVRGLARQWSAGLDPWQVTVRGEKWYGRGTVDNKGQHLIAIEALRAVLAERGQLGFNAKVLVETGEEQGSPGLRDILRRDRRALEADVFIGLDGPRQTTFMPEMKLGARGGVAFDLMVKLREHAAHSGHWGGVLADPGFILAHALSTIVTRKGRILVDGWISRKSPACLRRTRIGVNRA
jgi:acetylornithine deacetylase/succinyl-diaminopimelate desuccinylase-like protein